MAPLSPGSPTSDCLSFDSPISWLLILRLPFRHYHLHLTTSLHTLKLCPAQVLTTDLGLMEIFFIVVRWAWFWRLEGPSGRALSVRSDTKKAVTLAE